MTTSGQAGCRFASTTEDGAAPLTLRISLVRWRAGSRVGVLPKKRNVTDARVVVLPAEFGDRLLVSRIAVAG